MKVLNEQGLQYLWNKLSLEDYPNNETLIAVLNAIDETKRRRTIQEKYNEEHGITPTTINKEIREVISNIAGGSTSKQKKPTKKEIAKTIETIEQEMREAARNLDFERAMELRDILFEMKSN